MDRSSKPSWLFILLGIYLAAASAWALLVPPYEKPDELSHFDYLRFVAQEGRPPDLDEGLFAGWEAHQPPLYYFIGAGVYRLLPVWGWSSPSLPFGSIGATQTSTGKWKEIEIN